MASAVSRSQLSLDAMPQLHKSYLLEKGSAVFAMLKELGAVKQHPDEPHRRWFEDEYFDLIVWYRRDPPSFLFSSDQIYGFQLCYDKTGRECAVTWTTDTGYSHYIIKSDDSLWDMGAPVLANKTAFPKHRVIESFMERSQRVEPSLREFITRKLEEYAPVGL